MELSEPEELIVEAEVTMGAVEGKDKPTSENKEGPDKKWKKVIVGTPWDIRRRAGS